MPKLVPQRDRAVHLPAGFWLATSLLFLCLLLFCVSAQRMPAGIRPAAARAAPPPSSAPEITHTLYLPFAAANWVTTDVFTLGILGPFTGPSASTGAEFKGAVTMALEAIGWRIGHYRIKPVWIDSQSDPSKSAQAYEQAILQGGVRAGVLNWHSSVAVSCMEVTAQYQVPHFFGLGATEVVNDIFASDPSRYGYWTTKGWPIPAKLSLAYVEAIEYAIDTGAWDPPTRTLAIYGEDTDWGRGFGDALQAHFEEVGWNTVAEEYFPIDQTDFYTLLNDLDALNPTVIAGTNTVPPGFAAFVTQADQVGLQGLIIADGFHWFGDWYSLVGDAADYLVDKVVLWPTAEAQAFAADFEARWGFPPTPPAAGLAYDGVNLFLAAAQAVYQETGTLSSEALYAFAQDEIWTGHWTFDEGIMMARYQYLPETIPDPVVGEGFYLFPIVQSFGGEDAIIFPPAWAEQPLTPPPGSR